MNIPANIRVNAAFPFPALVAGSGPVTISKAGGIWTIGHSIDVMAPQVPPTANYATDFVLVWDQVNQTYFKMSLKNLPGSGGARAQRYTTATPIVVASSDFIINTKIATPAACALPQASSRAGIPVTFKDLGMAGTNNITLTAFAGDLIDGQGAYVLSFNYQSVTLTPFLDGVNTGWLIT